MAEKHEVDEVHTTTALVDMLTWNIGRSTSGKVPGKSDEGFALIRDAVITVVKPLLKKDTQSFLQEFYLGIAGKHDFKCVVAENDGNFKQAGVSTPPSEERGLKIWPGGDLLGKDKLEEEFGVDEDILRDQRICGTTVTIARSEYVCEIALLSYHAKYKTKEKQTKIQQFFKEMCKLADNMKMTIIIGGDFNLPVTEWRKEVEKKHEKRVSVVSYIGSPRRGDKYIDTFAIVQPTDKEDRTECHFKNVYAIYPFPLVDHVGGVKSSLINYPSDENPWFKCIHYSDEDKKKVFTKLKTKAIDDDDQEALRRLNDTQQNLMVNAAMLGAVDQHADARVDLTKRVRKLERITGVEETTPSGQLPEAEPAICPTR